MGSLTSRFVKNSSCPGKCNEFAAIARKAANLTLFTLFVSKVAMRGINSSASLPITATALQAFTWSSDAATKSSAPIPLERKKRRSLESLAPRYARSKGKPLVPTERTTFDAARNDGAAEGVSLSSHWEYGLPFACGSAGRGVNTRAEHKQRKTADRTVIAINLRCIVEVNPNIEIGQGSGWSVPN